MQTGSDVSRYALRAAFVVAVAACTTLALAPSLLLFPQPSSDDDRIALLAMIIVILLCWSYGRLDARRKILAWVATGAGVTAAAFLVLMLLPADMQLKIPTPNLLPRLLHVDGELADDTFLYELFNEIWLALAAVAIAIRAVSARLEKSRLSLRP